MLGAESQIDWTLLAGYASDLAFLEYGLGEELATVRAHLSESVEALTKVFELRATSFALPMIHVGGPAVPDVARLDYSLTNSQRGLSAMYLALIGSGQDAERASRSDTDRRPRQLPDR